MWDAIYGGLEPQPWPYNIARARPYINFPKIHSHLRKCNSERADLCPSTAYQGAKNLCIYMIWMWDAVYGALKPQPWLYYITRTQPYPLFPKNPHPPSEAYQCKVAPTCPSTAYQGAKTLCICIRRMWGAVYRGLEGTPADKTIKENPPKCILVKCPPPEVY